MGKKKVVEPEADLDSNKGPLPEDAPSETEPDEVSGSANEVVVKYRDHQGETVSRTFSKDVHGKEFKALAAEFKATNAARIVT